MSDALVLGLVEELERFMADPAWAPDPDYLLEWNQRFTEASTRAERGPGWSAVLDRAHALAEKMPALLARMNTDLDAIRQELAGQQQARRALKGYSATAR